MTPQRCPDRVGVTVQPALSAAAKASSTSFLGCLGLAMLTRYNACERESKPRVAGLRGDSARYHPGEVVVASLGRLRGVLEVSKPGFTNAVRLAAGHGDRVTSDPFTAGLAEVWRPKIIEAGLRNERMRGRTCSSGGGR